MRTWLGAIVTVGVSLFFPGALLPAEPQETAALEERISRGASLPDLIQYAYQTNPSVKAAREGWRAVIGRYRVETALPDPEVTSNYYP